VAKEVVRKEPDASGDTDSESTVIDETPKQGLVKKLLGNRKMLTIVAGGALVVLLGAGGAAYFFIFAHDAKTAGTKVAAADQPPQPIVPPTVAYYDMPDMVVNIQSADGNPAYLKLGVALELTGADEKAGIQPLMPRVVDQFQGYLRELRVDDLKGSAGVLRLKEELLRRINVAAAPFAVKDVLLKEIIVQ
jgi:flagellar FliL protein